MGNKEFTAVKIRLIKHFRTFSIYLITQIDEGVYTKEQCSFIGITWNLKAGT